MNRFAIVTGWMLAASAVACGGSGEREDGAVETAGALGTRPGETSEPRSRSQASDADIKSTLESTLRGVMFMSESDYEYKVLEADPGARVRSLSASVLRTRLKEVLKRETSSNRDISKRTCRAVKLSLSDVLADANLTDPEEKDSRQAGLAVKYMTEQLRGVVGFTFGTNESGDQDDEGPVVYVYAGISKTSGKIILIMTEAVYT